MNENDTTSILPTYKALSLEECVQLGYTVIDLYIFVLQWTARRLWSNEPRVSQEVDECMRVMIGFYHHLFFVAIMLVPIALGERLVKWVVNTLCERGARLMAILLEILHSCF